MSLYIKLTQHLYAIYTDLPIIASGSHVGLMDPHETILDYRDSKGARVTGKRFTMEEFRQYPGQVAALDGILGFSSAKSRYNGTLFRFPFRNEEFRSSISDRTYSRGEALRVLYDSLALEAHRVLLFLNHVTEIELYDGNPCAPGQPLLRITVNSHEVQDSRAWYKSACTAFSQNQGYAQTYLNKCTVTVEGRLAEEVRTAGTSSWLMCSTIGVRDCQVVELASQLKVIPWVGLAAPLSTAIAVGDSCMQNEACLQADCTSIENQVARVVLRYQRAIDWNDPPSTLNNGGFAFCFLPMSATTSTGLPVHIHGYFTLSDNRRRVRWPDADDNSAEANWNKHLVEHLIAPSYAILTTARCMLTSYQGFPLAHATLQTGADSFALLPVMSECREEVWKHLIRCVQPLLSQLPVLWTAAKNGMWVKARDAYFVPLDVSVHTSVVNLLLQLNCPIVCLPRNVQDNCTALGCKMISPDVVREYLRGDANAAKRILGRNEPLLEETLRYVLSNGHYNLQGLPLVPLQQAGIVGTFSSQAFYVLPKNDMRASEVLYGLESHIVSSSLPSDLQAHFIQMAGCKLYSLQMATSDEICPNLLRASIQTWCHNPNAPSVTWNPGQFHQPPASWLSSVWLYIADNGKLHSVAGLPLIAAVGPDALHNKGSVTLYPTQSSGSTVLRKTSTSPAQMESIAEALGCTVVNDSHLYAPFGWQLKQYLPVLSSDTLFAALQLIPHVERQVAWFDDGQKRCLRRYLAKAVSGLQGSLNGQEIALLQSLPVYEIGVGNQNVSFVALNYYSKAIFPHHSISFPTHLTFPSQIINVSEADQQLCEAVLQRPPLPLGAIVQQHIFNHAITQCNTAMRNQILLWVIQMSQYSGELEQFIKHKACIPNSDNRLCRVDALYDPQDSKLQEFFHSCEARFPSDDFYPVLHNLRQFGLRTWYTVTHSTDTFGTFLRDRSQSVQFLCSHGTEKEAHQRSKLILRAVAEHAESQHLLQCVQGQSFLFCQQSRPSGYNEELHWTGSGAAQLFSPSEVCASSNLFHLAGLVGSVCPILDNTYIDSVRRLEKVDGIGYFRSVSAEHVLQHFTNIISLPVSALATQPSNSGLFGHMLGYVIGGQLSVNTMVENIYTFLSHNRPQCFLQWTRPCIWNSEQCQFVEKSKVALKPLEGCSLAPHRYSCQDLQCLQSHEKVWRASGVKEQLTVKDGVQVVREIAGKPVQEHARDLEVVVKVANLLKDKKEVDYIEDMYLPSKSCRLHKSEDLTYHDHYLDIPEEDQAVNFIHPRITSDVARFFGVMSLSIRAAPSQPLGIDYECTGPHESITHRIKELVEDYGDSIDVFKELIQNADDAGATEVKFLIDWRTHNTGKLLTRDMAKWQGPALYAYNNKTFSGEDLGNICKVAGATKKQDHTKIGRFGVGFCATYHLTDVPSFITRRWLQVFDPHLKYLGDRVKPTAPGMQIDFVKEREGLKNYFSDQVAPYQGVFGCNVFGTDKNGFNGTIFRFPFRQQGIVSEISSEVFAKGSKTVESFKMSLLHSADTLLLFLRSVNKVELFECSEGSSLDKMQKLFQVSRTEPDGRALERQFRIPREHFNSVRPCSQMMKIVTLVEIERQQSQETMWQVCSAMGRGASLEHANSQDGQSQGLVPVAEVAVRLRNKGHSIAIEKTSGAVSCFLPLPIETSLNFVINAFFNVSKDRRLLKGSGPNTWNVMLMKDALVDAVFELLVALTELAPTANPEAMKEFLQSYFDLFPTKSISQKQPDGMRLYLAGGFVERLPLDQRRIIWSECEGGCFLKPSEVVVLSPDFDREPVTKAEKQVVHLLLVNQGVCVAEVPSDIREHFKQVTFKDFCCHHLFGRIESVPQDTRDHLVLFVLKHLFSLMESHSWLRELVQTTACIPSKPHNALCKPDYLVHPGSKLLASLYDESEGRFPAAKYSCQSELDMLTFLGMSHHKLKNDDVLDRVKSVQQVLTSEDADKAAKRSQAVVAYLTECHFKPYKQYFTFTDMSAEDEKLTQQLNTEPFLLTMPRPENTTLPWFVTKKSNFSAAECMYASCYKHLVCVRHEVMNDQMYGAYSSDLEQILSFCQRPALTVVLEQLNDLINWWIAGNGKHSHSAKDIDTISATMKSIYSYFKHAVFGYTFFPSQMAKDEEVLKDVKAKLRDIPFIWQEGFYRVDRVFWQEPYDCSPFLVKLQATGMKELLTELGVADTATSEQLILTLKAIAADSPHQACKFVDFACYAAKQLSVATDVSAASLQSDLYLPDEQQVMRHSSQLMYFDDRDYSWLEKHSLFQRQDTAQYFHLHSAISWTVAKNLGLNNPVQALLSKFSDKRFVKGLEFGQHEDLCDRLSNILQGYHPDTSIFKEFVQNADDAGASEIAFILDERAFSDRHLLSDSDNWKKLQRMPSLLVFNNRKFTDQDLEGITKLGRGEKQDTPETIGRFGIGFNVAYHVTDCPMFVSHKEGGQPEHFCVFDPTLSFAPDSTLQTPGERWELSTTEEGESLCSVFDSQFEPFAQDILQRLSSTCKGAFSDMKEPDSWPNGFVMFRLPLTRDRPLSSAIHSGHRHVSGHVVRGCEMRLGFLRKLLNDFSKEACGTLLFLNSVRKISMFEVSATNRCSLIGSYHAALPVADQQKCKVFGRHVQQGIECLSAGDVPQSIQEVYEVPVNSVMSVYMLTSDEGSSKMTRQLVEDRTTWVVSKRFGGQDLEESLLQTGFKCSFLPLGGVAAACPSKEQQCQNSGQLFCYMPLPLLSNLPVHINGHFWLNDSRRELQRGSSYHDLKDWNKSMSNNIICKAYAELLLHCRSVRVLKEAEDGAQSQQLDKEWYYNLFPKCGISGPLEDFQLPEQLYCYLLDNCANVLLYESDQLTFPTWLQLANPDGPEKGWFYSVRCGLTSQTLLNLGMKLTFAPMEIADRVNTSLQCLKDGNKYEGVVTPAVVREHLRSLCSQLNAFKSVIVESIVPLLKYCLSDVPTAEGKDSGENSMNSCKSQSQPTWQEYLDGVPLMLTEDRQLQKMHEVYDGKFTKLLSRTCEHLFIHKAVWKCKQLCAKLMSLGVVKELAESPGLVAKHLQLPRQNQAMELSPKLVKTLAQFWKYLACVEEGKREIFNDFSVIPTTDNKLYLLAHGKRILLEEPEMSLIKKFGFPVVDFGKVFCTETTEFTWYCHFGAVFAKSNNPNDMLQMLPLYASALQQKAILPKEEEVMEFLRFLQAASAISGERTLPWLKQLPIFFLVGGELKAIDGYREAHGVPKDVPHSGLDEISRAANIAFLVVPAFCEELLMKAGVTVWERMSLEFYSQVLTPLFSKLPPDQTPDILQEHMEVVFQLYKIFRYIKRTKGTWDAVFWRLSSVPFLRTSKGSACAAVLYDPKIEIFKEFLSAEMFPPSPWDEDSDPERLEFLGHLGLCRQVATNHWLKFARSLAQDVQTTGSDNAKGEQACTEKATLLLEDLAKWLGNPLQNTRLSKDFLAEASSICCVLCRIECEPHKILKDIVPTLEGSSQKWTTLQNSVLLSKQTHYQLACLYKPVLPACFSPELPAASKYLKDLGVIELDAVVVAHNLTSVARVTEQCRELPTGKRCFLVEQLMELFKAHYEYLDRFEGDEAPISAVLHGCKCIFIDNALSFQLLSADMVCRDIPQSCDLTPYVREVPSSCRSLKTFLKVAGVSDGLNISQCLFILRQLHTKSQLTDPNDKRVAYKAYLSLVELTRKEERCNGPDMALFQSGNIPLLTMDDKVVDASQLVLDDALWLQERLDERCMKYQVVKTPPQDDHGNITLPQCLGVCLLSSIISECPHEDMENEHIVCNEEQVAWSEGKEHGCKHVVKLLQILQSNELFNGILRVIKFETKIPPRDDMAEDVRMRLLGVEVKCVQMIKTVLHDEQGQEVPNSTSEDVFSLVWKENPDSSEAAAYISPHQKSVDMDELLYDLASGINQHLGGVIRDNALLIKMLACASPDTIPVVLNRHRVPMYEHGAEKEPMVSEVGEPVQHKEYLDNIILCSYRENEIVKYYSLNGQLINAEVLNMAVGSGDVDENGLSACTLCVDPCEDDTAEVLLAQLFISKYLQPQQAACFAKEWDLVIEDDDPAEAPFEPFSVFEMSIEDSENLKVQLESLMSQLRAGQVPKQHILYASQRLAYHLHYLCTKKKSSEFRILSDVLLRAAEPHLELLELQKLQETVNELLKKNEAPHEEWTGARAHQYGWQVEEDTTPYGGDGSHRRRHRRGRGGGGGGGGGGSGGGGGGMSSLWRAGYRNRDALWQAVDEEPPPRPNLEHAKMWLIQALNDYEASKSLLSSSQEKLLQQEGNIVDPVLVFPAQVCFLSHECAEKCLKTLFLALFGLDRMLSEQTNVRDLCQELQGNAHWPRDPSLDLMPEVLQVSRHYLRCRYPDYNTPMMAPVLAYMQRFEEAEEAVAAVESLLTKVRSISCIAPMMDLHSVPIRRRTPLDPAREWLHAILYTYIQQWVHRALDRIVNVLRLEIHNYYNSIPNVLCVCLLP